MNYSFPSNGIILDEDVVYPEEDPILFAASKPEDLFETNNWFQFDEPNEYDNSNNGMLLSEEFEMQSINLSVVGSPESQNNDVYFDKLN